MPTKKFYKVINQTDSPIDLNIRYEDKLRGYELKARGSKVLNEGEYRQWYDRVPLTRANKVKVIEEER